MAPAIITVRPDEKTMMWPLDYAQPGRDAPQPSAQAQADRTATGVRIVAIPERVVAVRKFSGPAVESAVREADGELRKALARDGLVAEEEEEASSALRFAQYDAVHSVGQRRNEVHIPLKDGGHPW